MRPGKNLYVQVSKELDFITVRIYARDQTRKTVQVSERFVATDEGLSKIDAWMNGGALQSLEKLGVVLPMGKDPETGRVIYSNDPVRKAALR
jgi:hypothetical protein